MAVGIIRTGWLGTSGGPGLTQIAIAETSSGGSGSFFTTTNVQTAVNAMRTFWDSLKALLPDEISLTVQPTVDIYNEANGQLIGSVSAPIAPTTVIGTSASTYSMASGMKAQLTTGVIANGRRVRGSVFIVPVQSGVFTTAGVVSSGNRTLVNASGATFIASLATPLMRQVVYSRPLKDEAGTITRNGFITTVNSWDTNEKGAILRGRRD